jgi:hypothetical protein
LEGGGDSIDEDNNRANHTVDDAQLIESLSEPGKPKNWKDIFNRRKANGNIQSYKSPDSLKSSSYHIQRRKKQKNNVSSKN